MALRCPGKRSTVLSGGGRLNDYSATALTAAYYTPSLGPPGAPIGTERAIRMRTNSHTSTLPPKTALKRVRL